MKRRDVLKTAVAGTAGVTLASTSEAKVQEYKDKFDLRHHFDTIMLSPVKRFIGDVEIEEVEGTDQLRATVSTSYASYHIRARCKDWNDNGYLGCIASVHSGGGNDLADGDYSFDTMMNIYGNIVSYEASNKKIFAEHRLKNMENEISQIRDSLYLIRSHTGV